MNFKMAVCCTCECSMYRVLYYYPQQVLSTPTQQYTVLRQQHLAYTSRTLIGPNIEPRPAIGPEAEELEQRATALTEHVLRALDQRHSPEPIGYTQSEQ